MEDLDRMAAQAIPKRAAWEDRFREPTPDELLKALTGPGAEAAAELRSRLLALSGVGEQTAWQGVPWRWALVYTCQMDPTRAFSYIIPDPARVQVAVPLTAAMVQSLPLKRMKKAVRDGIMFSRFVAGVYWPAWALETVGQLDELYEIVQRKYRGISGEWGGAGGGASRPASKRGDEGRSA